MNRIIITIFLITICSLNFFAQPKITKEEYKVYTKVLETVYNRNFKSLQKDKLVILEDTLIPSSKTGSLKSWQNDPYSLNYLYRVNPQKNITPQKVEEMSKSYQENNQTSATLKRKFKITDSYTIISQKELDDFLIVGRKLYDSMKVKPVTEVHADMVVWRPFLDFYQTTGCYKFSRVGFSKDKKFALVLAVFDSGISGDITYFIFEKVNNQWGNPKKFMQSWIV